MTDQRIEIYETYLKAWSAVSDDERAALLEGSLTAETVFTNPQKNRQGRADIAEHLQGFQKNVPGGTFRLNNMVGFDTYALIEWQLVDPKGAPGFTGYDAVTFAEDGRITNILMFVNEAPYKVAWHRRAVVEL